MNLSENYSKRLRELSGIIQEDRKRVEYLKGKFVSKYPDKHRERAEEVFAQIVASDPSNNKQYSQWLLNLFSAGSLKPEDLYKATEYLHFYNELKRKNVVPVDKRDIGKFKSLQELYDFISEVGGTGKTKEDENYLLEDRFFLNNGQAELIFENGRWMVVVPKTFDASQFYGCSSQWCTKFPEQFKNYSKDGPLIVIIDKSKLNQKTNKRRYQFHFPSNQFMDFADKPIDLNDFLIEHQDLIGGMAMFLIEASTHSGYSILNAEEVALAKREQNEEKTNYIAFDILPPEAKKLVIKRMVDNGLLVNKSWLDMMPAELVPTYIDNRLRKNGTRMFEQIWSMTNNRQKVYYFKKAVSKNDIIPKSILSVADEKLVKYYVDEMSKKSRPVPDYIYDIFSDENKDNYLNSILKFNVFELNTLGTEQVSGLGDKRVAKIIDKVIKEKTKFSFLLSNQFFDGLSDFMKNAYIGKVFQVYEGKDKDISRVLTKHQLDWGKKYGFL